MIDILAILVLFVILFFFRKKIWKHIISDDTDIDFD